MTQNNAIGSRARFVPGREPAGLARPRIARVASWAFLFLAAGLGGVFALQIATFEATAPQHGEVPGQQPSEDRIIVNAPTISGFDREDQPYEVTAAAAEQDSGEKGRVRLERVAATVRRRSGEILNLAATTALYDPETKALELDGAVRLESTEFLAEMRRARVLLDDKRFRSEENVVVTFGRGEISAGGMEITDDGKRIVFFNGARALFRPSAGKEDKQP